MEKIRRNKCRHTPECDYIVYQAAVDGQQLAARLATDIISDHPTAGMK
jgi:hypothetical protein